MITTARKISSRSVFLFVCSVVLFFLFFFAVCCLLLLWAKIPVQCERKTFRLRLVQFWELLKHHEWPYISKCTSDHTISNTHCRNSTWRRIDNKFRLTCLRTHRREAIPFTRHPQPRSHKQETRKHLRNWRTNLVYNYSFLMFFLLYLGYHTGIVGTLITGYLLEKTHRWEYVFNLNAVLLISGALIFLLFATAKKIAWSHLQNKQLILRALDCKYRLPSCNIEKPKCLKLCYNKVLR